MPRYLAVRVAVHHCKISNVPFLPFAIATIANHTTWTRYLRTTHRMAAESTLPPTLRQHGEAHRHLACILWCVVHVFNLELGDRRARRGLRDGVHLCGADRGRDRGVDPPWRGADAATNWRGRGGDRRYACRALGRP